MAKKYLLDSVILIDHFNGNPKATQFIQNHAKDCVISAITRAEVLTGFDEQQKPAVIKFLDKFDSLIIDKAVADLTAVFRRTYRIKLPDSLQATLAIYHNLVLVSRNTKDFKEGNTYLRRNDLVLCPYNLT